MKPNFAKSKYREKCIENTSVIEFYGPNAYYTCVYGVIRSVFGIHIVVNDTRKVKMQSKFAKVNIVNYFGILL